MLFRSLEPKNAFDFCSSPPGLKAFCLSQRNRVRTEWIPQRANTKQSCVMKQRNIIVTKTDLTRLQATINSARQDTRVPVQLLDSLEDELRRAQVVEPGELPDDVVSMESTIWFRDEADGDEECYTLVYPQQADVSQNKISVIAPIGTALLGYRIGDVVEWAVPAGISRLTITRVEHRSQPKPTEECAA